MANSDNERVTFALSRMKADIQGISNLLSELGYSLLPDKNQLLDVSILLQRKDLREKVIDARKLFSLRSQWTHPETGQAFSKEAVVLAFELSNEELLSQRWPFEITRYVSLHGMPFSQGILFFWARKGSSFAVTAYTQSATQPDAVVVRRLLVELENVARTDLESLIGLYGLSLQPKSIIQSFLDALPYSKVGVEFFSAYHTLFQIVTSRLLKTKALSSEEEIYEYAQRLLGRIVFLYFLQRKGWLAKDKAFLKKGRKGLSSEELFDWLHEVFSKLNNENRSEADLRAIPFLNGSLFEKDRYAESQMRKIRTACSPVLPELLETLDRYNFTISESTPLDKEVAVDPELLGNILESMLPEVERGDKGTFYTHQDEMLFMAREGIRSYLERFPDLLNKEQVLYLTYGIDSSSRPRLEPRKAREVKDKLRAIRILDPAVGSGGFLLAVLQTLLNVRRRLNGIIGAFEQDYDMKLEFVEKCLYGVDIESEAIELARLRLWLTLVVDESVENVRKLPNLDYNLYRGDSLKLSPAEKGIQTTLKTDHVRRKATTNLIGSLRTQFVKSYGKAKTNAAIELNGALMDLIELDTGHKPPDPIPFSYRYYFSDIMADGGFDLILMNPPYIRQEEIGRLPGQDPGRYKDEIISDMTRITGNKFVPDKKSDISVYFHVRALSLLKRGGTAAVIASSKWLDVGYGAPLQEYMLCNSSIEYVFESVDRSFSAGVNVVITIITKRTGNQLENLTRFVYLKQPFADVSVTSLSDILRTVGWKETMQYRLRTKTQKELLVEGHMPHKNLGEINAKGIIPLSSDLPTKSVTKEEIGYVGSKWGNVWLRAPRIYFAILERCNRDLARLHPTVGIKRGLLTGCNDYFILKSSGKGEKRGTLRCTNGFGYEFELEEKYCLPILRDPESVRSYITKSTEMQHRVFYCREKRELLRGSQALEYIKWGERNYTEVIRGKDKGSKTRICDLSTVKSRTEWYRLSDTEPSTVALPIIVKNRHLIPGSEVALLTTHNFDLLYCDHPIDLWLYLNSMVFRMFMELYGRIEGEGALQLMVEEYKLCPVMKSFPGLSEKFRKLEQFKRRDAYKVVNIVEEGPLELQHGDRKELDELVLSRLGFTVVKERESILNELYVWLQDFVRWRLERPIKAPKSPSRFAARRADTGIQTKI